MTSLTTFYLSRILGRKVYNAEGRSIGIVADLLVESVPFVSQTDTTSRPKVTGIKIKKGKEQKFYSFSTFSISKLEGQIFVTTTELIDLQPETSNNGLLLAEVILDKQIVDLNGRKLVRVNDVRLVSITGGTYTIAVDIGVEGLLRRIGIVKPVKFILSLVRVTLPAKFILWDDVEAVDFSNLSIKLSKSSSKLHTLHPSDLADIIEDLGQQSRATVFSSLNEEQAADVLEELEPHAQIHLVETLPVEKVADVLEKMPADEVADILDALEEDKAEMLLKEMEAESSQEVRELLEYEDNTVGSLMTTDYVAFNENATVNEVIEELRTKKPETQELYNLFVVDDKEELIATFSLRDLVVSQPNIKLNEIMKTDPIFLLDDDKVDAIAEIISKYNLLAVPVVDNNHQLQGMVVVDDVIEDLVGKRRTI